MPSRNSTLSRYLDAFEASITENPRASEEARAAAGRIFGRLRSNVGPQRPAEPRRLPVCGHLAEAFAEAGKGSSKVRDVAVALAELEPALTWARRASSEAQDTAFHEGHANALIVGAGANEDRSDIRIGVSLLAPHVTYPDHQHPPEEVYSVLSAGEWRRAGVDWFSPGIGGIVYNTPGVVHAMRSGSKPLLATWCLWLG